MVINFIEEFKKFAVKGNVIDLAIGVVIGTAFGAIINSIVGDIVMPLAGAVTGGIDFSGLFLVLREATDTSVAVTLNYGKFLNAIIDFLLIALAIFIVIKKVIKYNKKEEVKPKTTPEDTLLLREIRDSLKNQQSK